MKIRSRSLLIALTFASFGVSVPAVFADSLILDWGSRNDKSGGFDGGEFNASSATLDPVARGYDTTTMANINSHGIGFETFCVETNEYFTPGHTYYYQISDKAWNGGSGGGSPDPLSLGTAWLYEHFAQGTLSGYDYTAPSTSSLSALNLQNAIWWLEGEIGQDPTNQFENLVISHFGGAIAAMADNNGYFGVGILNLWNNANYTGNAQDQLILIPGGNPVPDGGTPVGLLGLGLLGLFLVKRKFARSVSPAPAYRP